MYAFLWQQVAFFFMCLLRYIVEAVQTKTSSVIKSFPRPRIVLWVATVYISLETSSYLKLR